jgi:general secretion pathway protein D
VTVWKHGFLAGVALLGALTAPLAAQQTVNLRDADVRAYIQDVARATGRTFIIDPRVQGKVSVVSERPLGREAYFELFLSTLRPAVPFASRRSMAPLPSRAGRGAAATASSPKSSGSIRSMPRPPSKPCARWSAAKAN